MKFIFVVLISLTLTFACQNLCNGHGECDTGDKCVCFPGWGGSECNLRICPYSDAFVDLLPGDLDHDGSVKTGIASAGNPAAADDSNVVKTEWSPVSGVDENVGYEILAGKRAHRYAECSNVGTCDRDNGLCECYSGFEGSACQRRSCPSSSEGLVCSGHGMCMSSEASIIHKQAAEKAAGGTGVADPSLPSGWEYEKFGVCVCDKGWTGISCGSRICPKGIDPVTKGSYTYDFKVTGTSLIENSDDIKSHSYKMVYDGITYTSPLIPERKDVCTSSSSVSEANEDIRRAISSIPPLSQSKVSVKCNAAGAAVESIDISTPYIELDLTKGSGGSSGCKEPQNGKPGYCTVDIGKTTGNLNTLSKPSSFEAVISSGSIAVGSITMIANSMSIDPSSGKAQEIKGGEFISCSGRGICDGSSGLCKCFEGYSGVACEKTRNS